MSNRAKQWLLGVFGISIMFLMYESIPYLSSLKANNNNNNYTTTTTSDITTKEPTTTQPINKPESKDAYMDNDGYKVYEVNVDYCPDCYYANVFFLKDGKLYSHNESNIGRKSTDDDGRGNELRATNVKDFYHVLYGNGGFEKFFYIDNNESVHEINNDASGNSVGIKPFFATRVTGVSNVKTIYNAVTIGAWEYFFINNDDQIISLDGKAYFDKVKGYNKTLVGRDVVEITFDHVDYNSDRTEEYIFYNININGEVKPDKYKYISTGEDCYECVDVRPFDTCYNNTELIVSSTCSN